MFYLKIVSEVFMWDIVIKHQSSLSPLSDWSIRITFFVTIGYNISFCYSSIASLCLVPGVRHSIYEARQIGVIQEAIFPKIGNKKVQAAFAN